jgi:hypothetical protein
MLGGESLIPSFHSSRMAVVAFMIGSEGPHIRPTQCLIVIDPSVVEITRECSEAESIMEEQLALCTRMDGDTSRCFLPVVYLFGTLDEQ